MEETIKINYGINQPEPDTLVIHIQGLGYNVTDNLDFEILDTTVKTVVAELYAHKNKVTVKHKWKKVKKYHNPHTA